MHSIDRRPCDKVTLATWIGVVLFLGAVWGLFIELI